jgi:molecular chaperone DnaJ
VAEQPCTRCDGRGREVRRRTLRVDVPAGIADGQRIRLSGRGHAGERGGPPGDLYVLVHVLPDERFVRDGDDLVTALDVPAPLAALGATLSAPSLDGEVEVEIEPGTQPGTILTVAGKGMPRLRRPGRNGNLRVVVNVVVPRKLTKDQRRLAQELADSMTDDNLRLDESLLGKLKRLLG